jgi:nitrate reductase delta subunit
VTAPLRERPVSWQLGFRKTNAANAVAVQTVEAWTRQRFALSEDCTVTVAELACKQPGCPPLETVVAFWTESGKRHRFKMLKPVVDVGQSDLPPVWLKNSLVDYGDIDTYCC